MNYCYNYNLTIPIVKSKADGEELSNNLIKMSEWVI